MSNINVHNIGLTYPGSKRFRLAAKRLAIGNESVPKIIMNNTINLFIKITVTILVTQTITVSECCVIKLQTYVLFEKNIFIFLHWKWPPQGTSTVPIVSTHFRSLTWPCPFIAVLSARGFVCVTASSRLRWSTAPIVLAVFPGLRQSPACSFMKSRLLSVSIAIPILP